MYRRCVHRRRRLIPAHAGKTSWWLSARWSRPAHPRSRGENAIIFPIVSAASGSSPLTRGKPPNAAVRIRRERLIPAHAGKTWSPPAPTTGTWAHPRSRGENFCSSIAACCAAGSSPLTRGKRHAVQTTDYTVRLIPAHAGKTRSARSRCFPSAAHPRSRGENVAGSHVSDLAHGSSPLTRGKRYRRWPGLGLLRLIPAHAGKTTRDTSLSRWRRAHPRSRGENASRRSRIHHPHGSSPLTRGKRCPEGRGRGGRRLIPAHAGKTCFGALMITILQAHPRSRGENLSASKSAVLGQGSSPLTRGKLMLPP